MFRFSFLFKILKSQASERSVAGQDAYSKEKEKRQRKVLIEN